jgi:hypothetical protein
VGERRDRPLVDEADNLLRAVVHAPYLDGETPGAESACCSKIGEVLE